MAQKTREEQSNFGKENSCARTLFFMRKQNSACWRRWSGLRIRSLTVAQQLEICTRFPHFSTRMSSLRQFGFAYKFNPINRSSFKITNGLINKLWTKI